MKQLRVIITAKDLSCEETQRAIEVFQDVGQIQEQHLFVANRVVSDFTFSEKLEEECDEIEEELVAKAKKLAGKVEGGIGAEKLLSLLAERYPTLKSLSVFYTDYSSRKNFSLAVTESICYKNAEILPTNLLTAEALEHLGDKDLIARIKKQKDIFCIVEVGTNHPTKAQDLGKKDIQDQEVRIIGIHPDNVISTVINLITKSHQFKRTQSVQEGIDGIPIYK